MEQGRAPRGETSRHILFVLRSLMYLRNYGSTIRELIARGDRVTLVCDVEHEKITTEIRSAARELEETLAIDIVKMPDARPGPWTAITRELRMFRDYARYFDPRLAFSRKCRARAESMLYPPFRRLLDESRAGEAHEWNRARSLSRLAQRLERCFPPPRHLREMLRREAPDAVVITPVIDFNPEQLDLIKAAKAAGIPCAHAVASWDNLTNKGLVQIEPDRMFVWNEAQRAEATELHDFPPDHVIVTGAQLFDHWFLRKPARDRAAFCKAAGLDPAEPFILYTCSSVFIARQESEFVTRWLASLRASPDPLIRDAGVLIRPHPGSTKHAAQWASPEIAADKRVAVFPAAGGYPVTEDAQADLYDSIYHANAVVGINTSVMLEAAIIGRNTLTLLDPALAESQSGMTHFRHLEQPGCVKIARIMDEHLAQLTEVLREAPGASRGPQDFVKSFLRPQGLDRPATAVLADGVEDLASLEVVPVRTPWYAVLVRAALLPVALWLMVVNWRRTTKKWDAKYTFSARVKTWIAIQLGLVEDPKAKKL